MKNRLRPLMALFAGLGVPGLASAAPDDALWMTLIAMPDWLSFAIVVLGFGLLAALMSWIWKRSDSSVGRRAPILGAAAGSLLGAVLALLLAQPWQDFLISQLDHAPPSAAGPGGGRPAADLLGMPEAMGPQPSQAPKEIPGRGRTMRFNASALSAERLNLDLLDDVFYVAVRDRVVQDARGGFVWIGHVEDQPGSEVVLAARGAVLMGTVQVGGRFFEIVYVGGSTHAVRELDPRQIPEQYEPDLESLDTGTTTSGGTDTSSSATVTSTGQVIDVMVVYTPKARQNAGGTAGIEARILNAVARANQAYLNSQINMQLNLVHMAEIAYTETTGMSLTLSHLRGTTDGFMDEVHAWRNQYGADQVALISADKDNCGIASLMTSPSVSFAPMAFAVVHDDSVYNCLGSNNTFAHELGHNQGNMHDKDSSSYGGAYPDSYGYRICGVFRDIMAYSCSGETRIPYFSNPNVLYQNRPTGVAGSADTARSMNATAPIVASFRTPSSVSAPPQAPTSLAATAFTDGSVELSWVDASSDESGFRIQRSTDGANWSEIASLPAGTTRFTVSGLTAGSTHHFRVYAFNAIGNSAYSNTAQATLAAPPPAAPDTQPPTASLMPGAGSTVTGVATITGQGQDNVAVARISLSIDGSVVATVLNPGTSGSAVYKWNTKKAGAGPHQLSLTVTDGAGLSTTVSHSVTVK